MSIITNMGAAPVMGRDGPLSGVKVIACDENGNILGYDITGDGTSDLPADPWMAYHSLDLRCDGDVLDQSASEHSLSLLGAATLVSDTDAWGGGAVNLASGGYIKVAANCGLDFRPADEFTIRIRVKPSNPSAYQYLLSGEANSIGEAQVSINIPIGGSPRVSVGRAYSDWPLNWSGTALGSGYLEICWSRKAGYSRCLVNGAQLGADIADSIPWRIAGAVALGWQKANGSLIGRIDQVIITPGICTHWEAYTPTEYRLPGTGPLGRYSINIVNYVGPVIVVFLSPYSDANHRIQRVMLT